MFSESADLYDVIYSVFKDYAEEAAALAALLGRVNLKAITILDVGCGTGEHARLLRANHGFEVDGLDLDQRMVELAAARNPAGRFVTGDMINFDLARQYDAVLCLFSSIGYVRTLDRLSRAVGCMA
ncbi:MAG: class I SAM-dependent methyltransferase [Gemmatimonadetes bacterium]|nr:class I SAM-dependent methyltransferase [Gemmatimonadota bacterium]